MELKDYFKQYKKTAVAFSGGTDSALLLHAARESGSEVIAYYVRSPFQPRFEYEDALRLTEELGIKMVTISADPLKDERIASNPPDRCYHCKRMIFSLIFKAALEDGCEVICDGTNASDDEGDRPGMRALSELSVRSPLRECGLTKGDVRKLSKAAGLFTWDKPSYACLATRIPSGSRLSPEKLMCTEAAEEYLFDMGFTDFRIRMPADGRALVQLRPEQLTRYRKLQGEIEAELGKYYDEIILDPEGRR